MPIPSYYVLCLDYGRDGREAIVDPEETRRQVVTCARDILAKGDREISFVHFVHDGAAEDITAEIIAEAQADIEAEPIDRDAWHRDHERDLRKHEVA